MNAPEKVDRMAVNAAIEYLASGKKEQWQDAAATVVHFGVRIGSMGNEIISVNVDSKKDGKSASGFAAGIGNVTIRDDEKKTYRKAIGDVFERVGVYIVRHFQNEYAVGFRHFKSDGPWALTKPFFPEFWVYYEPSTQEPHTVMIIMWKEVPLPLLLVLRASLQVMVLKWKRFLREGFQFNPNERGRVMWSAKAPFQLAVVHALDLDKYRKLGIPIIGDPIEKG